MKPIDEAQRKSTQQQLERNKNYFSKINACIDSLKLISAHIKMQESISIASTGFANFATASRAASEEFTQLMKVQAPLFENRYRLRCQLKRKGRPGWKRAKWIVR